MMINRDGSPSAITGAVVPETWLADFAKITAPLAELNPKWPFKLERGVPRAHATSPGGTDSSSFEMLSVPTLRFTTQSDYNYRHAWHTLYDLYSELVPYTEHQRHSALVTAVVAYGAANLPRPLPAEGVYLADGLYADIAMSAVSGDSNVVWIVPNVGNPTNAIWAPPQIYPAVPPGPRGASGAASARSAATPPVRASTARAASATSRRSGRSAPSAARPRAATRMPRAGPTASSPGSSSPTSRSPSRSPACRFRRTPSSSTTAPASSASRARTPST